MDKYSDTKGSGGYVYVLKNKCFKEPWLQIGSTEHSLESELETLSHELPHDFEVVYTAQTGEHQYITQRVHEALSEFRVEPDRRFFLVSEQQAVESVRDVLVELDAQPAPELGTQTTVSHDADVQDEDDVQTHTAPGPIVKYTRPLDFNVATEELVSGPEEETGVHAPNEPQAVPVDAVEPTAGDEGDAEISPDAGAETGSLSESEFDPKLESAAPAEPEAGAATTLGAIALTKAEVPQESTSLDPYLVTDFGYLYIVKPVKRVQVTARLAFGITTLGPQHLLKECRRLFDLNPRQLQLIYYGWLETSDTAERMIRMELGRFAARSRENLFRCPLSWVAECAFQIPGLLSDYRFLRIALGRWARYYDRTPFYAARERRAKLGELERERQDFDVEKSVIEARLGHRVRPLVLEEYPPGWKPKKIDHGFDLVTDDTDHGVRLPNM